jgi:hypothetical protein
MARPSFYLDFQNDVFVGTYIDQVTIRKGRRWYDALEPGDLVTVGNYAAKHITGKAVIIGVKFVSGVELIEDSELFREHDPKARTLAGLVDVLTDVYGEGFDDEGLTVVTFQLLSSDATEDSVVTIPLADKVEVTWPSEDLDAIDAIIAEEEAGSGPGQDQQADGEGADARTPEEVRDHPEQFGGFSIPVGSGN